MQLKKFTDFALRLLIQLAVTPGEWVNIATVASTYGVPRNHLLKIVTELHQQGLIQTHRGKHGGVQLAVAATAINVGDLLQHLEGGLPIVNCDQPQCPILPACELRRALDEAEAAFFNSLRRYSLADLVQGQQQNLQRLMAN